MVIPIFSFLTTAAFLEFATSWIVCRKSLLKDGSTEYKSTVFIFSVSFKAKGACADLQHLAQKSCGVCEQDVHCVGYN